MNHSTIGAAPTHIVRGFNRKVPRTIIAPTALILHRLVNRTCFDGTSTGRIDFPVRTFCTFHRRHIKSIGIITRITPSLFVLKRLIRRTNFIARLCQNRQHDETKNKNPFNHFSFSSKKKFHPLPFPAIVNFYSYRKASTGSVLEAFHDGYNVAKKDKLNAITVTAMTSFTSVLDGNWDKK